MSLKDADRYGKLSSIRTMRELRMHKLRVDMATDFLEERLRGNVKSIKHKLTPIELFKATVRKITGSSGADHASGESAGLGSGMFLDIAMQIIKGILRIWR